jgi:hypothetical protein
MKIEQVTEVLEQIKIAVNQGDYEKARCLEDTLRHDVLLAISTGARGARKLANAALESSLIDFERYCA